MACSSSARAAITSDSWALAVLSWVWARETSAMVPTLPW